MPRTPPAFDFTGPNWPKPLEVLLLRACLTPDASAVAAWRAWQKQVAFDDLDPASLRLIPLLCHNLTRLGVDDPDLGRYRGIQRKSWYENQVLFQKHSVRVIQLLQGKGIRTLLLKGAPLAQLYYPNTALRAMSDIDVLVPYAEAERAMTALQDAGWAGLPGHSRLRSSVPHVFRGGHAWTFSDATGATVDLHWRTIRTTFSPSVEESFWTGAQTLRIGNAETLTLNATDHLLHTCLHALPLNEFPPIRWVADALFLIRSETIDWERLITQMQAHRSSILMLHALTYLREGFAAPIPASVLQRIQELPVERWEHAEFLSLTSEEKWPVRRRIWVYGFLRYQRTEPAADSRSALASFLEYWQMTWDVETTGALLQAGWRRCRNRLLQRNKR